MKLGACEGTLNVDLDLTAPTASSAPVGYSADFSASELDANGILIPGFSYSIPLLGQLGFCIIPSIDAKDADFTWSLSTLFARPLFLFRINQLRRNRSRPRTNDKCRWEVHPPFGVRLHSDSYRNPVARRTRFFASTGRTNSESDNCGMVQAGVMFVGGTSGRILIFPAVFRGFF